MARLKAPLAEQLVDPADEAGIQEGWQAIRARRERPTRRGVWIGGFAIASAVALVAVLSIRRDDEPKLLRLDEGPLLVGAKIVGGLHWDLSDGSSVFTESSGEVEVGELSLEALHLVLREGSIFLDVRSHGHPMWSVDCGVAMVEITGTRLAIERLGSRVEIKVSEGTVRVKSTALTPPVQYVHAGEALVVNAPIAPRPEPPIERPVRRAKPTEDPKSPDPIVEPSAPEPSLDELLRRADAARKSGDAEGAVEILGQVEARDHGTKGALAAFTLGRVLLDDLGDASAAAAAFERALSLPLPEGLTESALARAVEAQTRAGNKDRAASRAKAYLERFPSGPHRAQVEKWAP